MDFPYKPRKYQDLIIKDMEDAFENGKHLIMEAVTGSGKTICALYSAINSAKKNGKKILYLTRTNAQQERVLEEMKNFHEEFGIGIQGRNNLCTLFIGDEELKRGSPEELSRLCREMRKNNECEYYTNFDNADKEEILEWIKKSKPLVNELHNYCIQKNICTYETIKEMAKYASVVTVPYIYFFSEYIQSALLQWMQTSLEDLYVIVDEAHNLPSFAREFRSLELTMNSLKLVDDEAIKYNTPILKKIHTTDLTEFIRESIFLIKEEYLDGEDGVIPPYALEEELMVLLKINSLELKNIAKQLMDLGEMIKSEKIKQKKLPRSYIYHLGSFLYLWIDLYSYDYVKVISGGENTKIEAYCLDPSPITEIINKVYGSVHMSGTLSPLEEYKDSIGLRDAELKSYESPFPKENMFTLYLEDVTTKYEELIKNDENIKKIAGYIEKLSKIGRNTAVFFPSYTLMKNVEKLIGRDYKIIMDDQTLSQPMIMNMMEKFKTQGGTFFSVMGGRISEGMDFPESMLEIVVIVGIPYPKPTVKQKALQFYYDSKFQKGWEYAVKAPTTRKIKQAIGRLIRTENDRGLAIILDKRAIHFKEYIEMKKSKKLKSEIEEFFY